jgi:alanyl-tRNA synthetase
MEKDVIRRIVVNPKVMVGKPVIKGTRVTVYEIVNRVAQGQSFEAIEKDLPVYYKELPIEEAKKTGSLYFFKEKYPEKVKVYFVGDFSKEFCGGPHVGNTLKVGKFKIIKQETVGAGVRRIRAIVDKL